MTEELGGEKEKRSEAQTFTVSKCEILFSIFTAGEKKSFRYFQASIEARRRRQIYFVRLVSTVVSFMLKT